MDNSIDINLINDIAQLNERSLKNGNRYQNMSEFSQLFASKHHYNGFNNDHSNSPPMMDRASPLEQAFTANGTSIDTCMEKINDISQFAELLIKSGNRYPNISEFSQYIAPKHQSNTYSTGTLSNSNSPPFCESVSPSDQAYSTNTNSIDTCISKINDIAQFIDRSLKNGNKYSDFGISSSPPFCDSISSSNQMLTANATSIDRCISQINFIAQFIERAIKNCSKYQNFSDFPQFTVPLQHLKSNSTLSNQSNSPPLGGCVSPPDVFSTNYNTLETMNKLSDNDIAEFSELSLKNGIKYQNLSELTQLIAPQHNLNGFNNNNNNITNTNGALSIQSNSPPMGGSTLNGSTSPSDQAFAGNGNLNPPVRNGKMTHMQIRSKFGQLGPAKAQFNSPHGFCIGSEEEIIVADTNNHRIQIFDKNGEYKYHFGMPGREEGQLWYPRKVTVMPASGKFVVCDRGNERSRMQIFNKNGHFIKKIAIRYIDIVAGLAITAQGNIVAVDSVSPTVFCISEAGDLLKWFDCSDYMREPSDIAINNNDYYVCDFKGHCVVVFNEEGTFLRRIGGENITNFPNGIDVSDDGDVLVGDSHGNRFHVAVFSRDGTIMNEFECPYVKVSRCCGLKITSEGYVVTLAKNNHHVLILNTLYMNN